MIKIIFITGSRSDYFIQRPILNLLKKNKKFKVHIILTGAHLSKKYGYTSKIVKKDKFGSLISVKSFHDDDSLESRSLGASKQFNKIVKIIAKIKPDIAIAPYDREEAITLALAATYNNIPVAHLGAGDKTEYNVDVLIRHAVSKLAQYLFTSTEENKKRLIKMGENKGNIYNVGHTALDRYKLSKIISKKKLEKFFRISFSQKPVILFIQHPVSNDYSEKQKYFKDSLKAIDELDFPTVIVKPNSDPGSSKIIDIIDKYEFKKNKHVSKFKNIPESYFVNLMRNVSLILGNSSMGILESAINKTPVVNIGKRQTKRQNSGNVIFASHKKNEIIKAVKYSLYNRNYQKKLRKCKNIYGTGNSSKKIINILSNLNYKKKSLIKLFP